MIRCFIVMGFERNFSSVVEVEVEGLIWQRSLSHHAGSVEAVLPAQQVVELLPLFSAPKCSARLYLTFTRPVASLVHQGSHEG